MCAMGSCIKVLKQKNLVSYWKKNVVSCNRLKLKRPLFCHGYSQNYILTPAPSEIASQFPPPHTVEQTNKNRTFHTHLGTCGTTFLMYITWYNTNAAWKRHWLMRYLAFFEKIHIRSWDQKDTIEQSSGLFIKGDTDASILDGVKIVHI
jgi:hypothetical protein